jgi:hypothetical protein
LLNGIGETENFFHLKFAVQKLFAEFWAFGDKGVFFAPEFFLVQRADVFYFVL